MQGSNQQQYDRGVSLYSPEGRLYQVEYAREAVKRGSPSVGVCGDTGVALAALTRTQSPLQRPDGIEKIHRVEEHLGAATAGHVTDGRKLVDKLRLMTQQEQLRYGQQARVNAVSRQLADFVQEFTQTGGRRPFGSSVLVGGVDDSGPSLFEVEPGGTPNAWDAVSIGSHSETVMDALEDGYESGLDTDGAVELAVNALTETTDEQLAGNQLAVATITEDEGHQFLSTDDVDSYLPHQ